MHDIKLIRHDPAAFDAALAKRGVADAPSSRILALDEQLRAAVTAKQDAETARNAASKQIGKAKAQKDEAKAQELMAEVAQHKATMEAQDEVERDAREALTSILEALPNLALEDVPVGADEAANVEVAARRWGTPTELGFEPRDHVDLGESLGLMDFETAVAMSGSRFVLLSGQLARLERALAAFMLDLHVNEHGYTEVSPPYLVRGDALYGTGQLPKFEEDLYKTNGDHYLIPTAEVPLTNIVAGQILAEDDAPRRYVAHTPCFRSEAGSAGRDTRGMIRLHQFDKVELVSITTPQESDAELERMTDCAQEVLKRLELPHKVLTLSTGDMGFAARKTYDLEVWIPSQGVYREISSCSTCGDFQARRMDAKYRPASADGKKTKPEFLHTLNGSGVAVGRCLVALMENFQQADGSIAIPDALRSYVGGLERIGAAGETAPA